jgi:hypothetical protein
MGTAHALRHPLTDRPGRQERIDSMKESVREAERVVWQRAGSQKDKDHSNCDAPDATRVTKK